MGGQGFQTLLPPGKLQVAICVLINAGMDPWGPITSRWDPYLVELFLEGGGL